MAGVAFAFAAGGAASAVAAAPGTVALWEMDETSGTEMRDEVGTHTGTLHSVQLGRPGFAGTAYGFGGSGHVSVRSAADLNPGGQDVTITIHLQTTQAPASPDWDLIRKGVFTDPGEYKMEYQPSGQASCGFMGSAGSSELIAGPRLNDGQWHSVQCVKTSSAIKLIVDGRTFSQSARIGSINTSAAVVIGAHPGSEFFRGTLDQASIQIGTGQAQPSPSPPPAPAPSPAPQPSPAPAPAPAPPASPTPRQPVTEPAPELDQAPASAVETPAPSPPQAAPTLLSVGSSTRGRTALVLHGRLSPGASAGQLRVTLTRRTRHLGNIRVTARATGGRSGTWRAVLRLPRAARTVRRFDVAIGYLGEPGHAPARLRLGVLTSAP
ncbi:MAG TPA: laminin G domain-containing protein [Solirubrobacteraceae bacterium]